MEDFNTLTALFNTNLKKIKRELGSGEVNKLYKLYAPESDEHLAKILSLRSISI